MPESRGIGWGASRHTGRVVIATSIALLLMMGIVSAVLFLGTGAPAAGQGASAPKAYIGLFKDNAIGVLDTGTNQLLTTIPVPAGPHGLASTLDGRKVYASSDGDSTVSIIDTATDSVVGSIDVGKSPHGLAMTPDGEYLLVAVFGANQVVFVDTKTDRVVGQVPVSNPHNIAVSPDGARAYVAAQGQGAIALAILDVENRTQVGSVPLDKTPRALNFSPDGKQLYFTQAGLDSVQVLDPSTNQVVAQIPVGASPHHPIFTPAGDEALVVAQGPNELSILDPVSNTVKATLSVGQFPHWIAVTADGRTAYVTNENSGDLSVVDLGTQAVTQTIPVGNGPRKIVIQGQGATMPMPGGGMEPASATPGVSVAPAQPSAPVESSKVSIANFAFGPAGAMVGSGQSVTWTNEDSVPHTVTADDGSWDSGTLQPGATFSKSFDQPGSYGYHCSLHPFMHGSVEVKG